MCLALTIKVGISLLLCSGFTLCDEPPAHEQKDGMYHQYKSTWNTATLLCLPVGLPQTAACPALSPYQHTGGNVGLTGFRRAGPGAAVPGEQG